MSHHIETMAYTGQTPWHQLGHALPQKQPLEVWAQAAGMQWQILETPVRYLATEGQDAASSLYGEPMEYPEQKVLYRSDTKAPLSVVSNRYQVVQPRDVLEFYRDLTEVAGYELETAGVLKAGRKFWALARTGKSVALKGDDQVNGYLLLATSCDGTLATVAMPTTVRVVCSNTLAIALQGDCGTFVLRTTGVNTVRTLMARMQYLQAVSGGLLAYLPLELRLRGKSTTQSRRAPIYYVDLSVRDGMGLEAAVGQARQSADRARHAGLYQAALDAAARKGYAQGLFEETAEEVSAVLQEFFPRDAGGLEQGDGDGHSNDR